MNVDHRTLGAVVALAMCGCFDFSRESFGHEGEPCFVEDTCSDNLACGDQHVCVNPCDATDCSGHGTCRPVDGVAVCRCDDGYVARDASCVGPGQLNEECTADAACDGDLFCDPSRVCVGCTSTENKACVAGSIYALDSCGRRAAVFEHCGGFGCSGSETRCLLPNWLSTATVESLLPNVQSSSIALTRLGYVIAASDSVTGEIYAWRSNSDVPVELSVGSTSGGGVSKSPSASRRPSILETQNGAVYVAWIEQTAEPDYLPIVRYLSGDDWVDLNCAGAEPAYEGRVTLAADGDQVYFSWSGAESTSVIWKWDGALCSTLTGEGSGWVPLDSIGSLAVSSEHLLQATGGHHFDLGTHPYAAQLVNGAWHTYVEEEMFGLISYSRGAPAADGTAFVAVSDAGYGSGDVFVMTNSNGLWRVLGGNISSTTTESTQLAFALDDAGYPLVAWIERLSSGSETHLSRWNGRAWIGFGDRGADRSIVSLVDRGGTLPSILSSFGGLCVLLQEGPGMMIRCTTFGGI